jgi:hypothetical protein
MGENAKEALKLQFDLAEVAVSRELFAAILERIRRLSLVPG